MRRSGIELRALQAFRTIFGSARVHDSQVREAAGVSGSQLWALSEIARTDGLTVNALSRSMALHQTTASNLVNALVARRLIRRVRGGTDQRVVRLFLTGEGKRLLQSAPSPQAGLLVEALRQLQPLPLGQLLKALENVVAVMKRPARRAAGRTLLGE
jgi:DNA-binding MarR family transcriptional regulator